MSWGFSDAKCSFFCSSHSTHFQNFECNHANVKNPINVQTALITFVPIRMFTNGTVKTFRYFNRTTVTVHMTPEYFHFMDG